MHSVRDNRVAIEQFHRDAHADARALAAINATHRPERVERASAPIRERAQQRHAALVARLAASVRRAREEVAFAFPAHVQRRAVLHDPAAPLRAAALMELLRAAPPAELLAMAESVALRRDDVIAHAIRAACAARADLSIEQLAPVVAVLDAWHAPTYQQAIDNLIGAQVQLCRAEQAGPFADGAAPIFADPAGALRAHRAACAFVSPNGELVQLNSAEAEAALIGAGVKEPSATEARDDSDRHPLALDGLRVA